MHSIKIQSKSNRKEVLCILWSLLIGPHAHTSLTKPLCLACQRTLAETNLEATSWLPKGHSHRVRKAHLSECELGYVIEECAKAYFMHHYQGLISNDGNWPSILTISGRDLQLSLKIDNCHPHISGFCTVGTERQALAKTLNCLGSIASLVLFPSDVSKAKSNSPQQVGWHLPGPPCGRDHTVPLDSRHGSLCNPGQVVSHSANGFLSIKWW